MSELDALGKDPTESLAADSHRQRESTKRERVGTFEDDRAASPRRVRHC